jgi:hypothetical protein
LLALNPQATAAKLTRRLRGETVQSAA